MTTAAALDSFRADVRAWFAEHTPAAIADSRHPDRGAMAWGGRRARIEDPAMRTFYDELVATGWIAPTWSKDESGAGLSAAEAAIVRDEATRVSAGFVLQNFGTLMVGPLIRDFGTDEQRRRHLTAMARGEIAWCLGFSEPDHGSDLAGLQCRAVRDGEVYVVTGAKVWNSRAHRSDFMELLVRTDPDAPKHHGISVLMVDLSTPGISISPIELISGGSDFCETRFDEVRVPVDHRLGPEHDGWRLVQHGLRFEREAVVTMAMAETGFTGRKRATLDEIARHHQVDPSAPLPGDVASQIAAAEIEQLAFRATQRRAADAARAGQPAPHPSVLKYVGAKVTQRRRDLEMALRGTSAIGWKGAAYTEESLRSSREWLRAFGLSIEGGTSEIQLNIIARRVLDLPLG